MWQHLWDGLQAPSRIFLRIPGTSELLIEPTCLRRTKNSMGGSPHSPAFFCSPLHRIHLRVTSKMLSAPCQAPLVKPAGADCGYVPKAVTFKVKDLGCHLGVTASADLPTAACLSTSCKVSLAENIWIRVRVRPDNQVFWKPKKLWSHICVCVLPCKDPYYWDQHHYIKSRLQGGGNKKDESDASGTTFPYWIPRGNPYGPGMGWDFYFALEKLLHVTQYCFTWVALQTSSDWSSFSPFYQPLSALIEDQHLQMLWGCVRFEESPRGFQWNDEEVALPGQKGMKRSQKTAGAFPTLPPLSKSTLAGCWKLVTDATSPQRSRKGANMGQLLSLDWKQLLFIHFLFYVFSVCASFQLKIMKHHSKMAPLPSAGYSTLK